MNNLIDQNTVIEEVKEFAQKKIRPFATIFENEEKLPNDLITNLAKNGYLTASIPRDFGGLELDSLHYGLFTEEIGKACCNTRGLITVNTSLVAETLLKWGSIEQKMRWLPMMSTGEKIGAFALTEPTVGTDAKNIQCTYSDSNSGYILNGKKKWISFAEIADFFIVVARGEKGISTFIVERNYEGIEVKPIKGLLANKASHISEIEFKNVEIPRENLLSKEGCGFSFVVNTALDNGRYSIAWAGVAIAQEALDAMVKYSRNRNQFGKGIHTFQHIQGMIADATTNIHAARALCIEAANNRMNKGHEAVIKTTIAKYFSSKIAMNVAIDAVQVHGGNGCYSEYPVERLFREAKVLEIIEGTSQIQKNIISSYALRKYYYNTK